MTEQVANVPTYCDAIRQFVKGMPIGWPGIPEDMAKAVSFLLGPDAGFICGSVLFADGGHDAMLRPDQSSRRSGVTAAWSTGPSATILGNRKSADAE